MVHIPGLVSVLTVGFDFVEGAVRPCFAGPVASLAGREYDAFVVFRGSHGYEECLGDFRGVGEGELVVSPGIRVRCGGTFSRVHRRLGREFGFRRIPRLGWFHRSNTPLGRLGERRVCCLLWVS